MPQLQNLSLMDTETIPVSHTFTPRDIIGGVATVEESTGVPIGNSSISVSLRKTASGNYKSVLKGRFPIVQNQTVNGVTTPVVVRTSYAELTLTFDATSSEAERWEALNYMRGALDGENWLYDVLCKLQGVY